MTIITIKNDSEIAVRELNEVLQQCRKSPRNSQLYSIRFTNEVERMDIVFIAGLFLAYQTWGHTFSLDKESAYIFPYTSKTSNQEFFTYRQYAWDIEDMYGPSQKWLDLGLIKEFSAKDKFGSRSFAPVLYIDSETIKALFEKENRSGKFFDKRQRSIKLLTGEENYIDINDEAIIPPHAKDIKTVLEVASTIEVLVFEKLYHKTITFLKKHYQTEIEGLQALLEFSEEYVRGLHELAKNIVDHSSFHKGVITIRLYDRDFDGDLAKLFETYVFDYGEIGVVGRLNEMVNNYVKKYNNNDEEDVEEIQCFKDDSRRLKNDYHFSDFLSPKYETLLSHQIRRDIAHYGLLSFLGLIRENQGDVFASSVSYTKSERDTFASGRKEGDHMTDLCIGTFYFFRFPVILPEKQPADNHVPAIPYAPTDISLSFEKTMRLDLLEDLEVAKHNKHDSVFQLRVKEMLLNERIDEDKLKRQLNSIPPSRDVGGMIKYIAIDLSKVKMNSSNLLRILAFLSYHTSIPVVVYNVNVTVFLAMIRDNRRYYEGLADAPKDFPYWFKDRAILLYSYLDDGLFYFADILYGNDELEFLNVNRMASRSFPNSISITNRNRELGDKRTQITGVLTALFQNSILTPFDIMLKDDSNQLIFLRNLKTILEKNVYDE